MLFGRIYVYRLFTDEKENAVVSGGLMAAIEIKSLTKSYFSGKKKALDSVVEEV